MAYSIQSSGQLVYTRKEDNTQLEVSGELVQLERRELCSNSLFKQGSYEYFYYFFMEIPQGEVKWLVKVISGQQHTEITHSHCYKSPNSIDVVTDVDFSVNLVEECATEEAV